MTWRRELILAVGFIILTILFLGALLSGSIPSSPSLSSLPPPPTAVSLTPQPTVPPTTVPPLISCTLRGGGAGAKGPPASKKTVRLNALHVACGCVKIIGRQHPAAWHGHRLTHGVQFTGSCAGAVFRLRKRYSQIAGRIYVDDSTGTVGGILTLYNAVVPTNSATYAPLFEENIGYAPQHEVPFTATVAGVANLAIVERCCTVQNTVFDVVATLTKPHAST